MRTPLLLTLTTLLVSCTATTEVTLKAQLAAANHCEVKEDCELIGSKCPFDCYIYVHKDEADRLKPLVDNFESQCTYSCIATQGVECLQNKCVVIADQWGQYLEAVFARDTAQGFAIPPWMAKGDFAGYGMMMPRSVEVTRKDAAAESRFWFPSDPGLLDVARKIAGKVDLSHCVEANSCLSKKPRIVVGGAGVSGQAFVDNAKFREYVAATFQAKVLDMESAAVAHVAYSNGVRFLAVRSLSDLAGGDGGANEMMTFMALASKNSATVVKEILKEMR